MTLEPLPETREALLSLGRWSDHDLTAELIHQGELAEEIVPNLVGLSLAMVRDGLTFTIAATSGHLRLLDAIQYAFGGPCVDAALHDSTVHSGDSDAGLFDERRWVAFARVGAAHGVLSTLSMPIHSAGRVIAGVNLYARTPNAFAGREQRLADLLGAWAPGAVHNADLSFSTREAARDALRVLGDNTVVDQATGVVMAARGVDRDRAREIIDDAARRSGQDALAVARELTRPYFPDDAR